ncbi:MAG: hypothetical protein QNJ15_02605 [Erythrobacter sp.]|nr:hypothetical protein [Erythrobacter sp.]
MKAIQLKLVGALAMSLSACGCIPSVEAPAAPPPAPVATPAPTPTPAPPPPAPVIDEPRYENYLDAPQTLGTWTYETESAETFALFGTSIASPVAIIRCDRSTGLVGIGRFGSSAQRATIRIRTETGVHTLQGTPRNGGVPLVAAEVNARDPMLDAMAITKGRFALETEGLRTLYLPAWAEVTRVIEDCR